MCQANGNNGIIFYIVMLSYLLTPTQNLLVFFFIACLNNCHVNICLQYKMSLSTATNERSQTFFIL